MSSQAQFAIFAVSCCATHLVAAPIGEEHNFIPDLFNIFR